MKLLIVEVLVTWSTANAFVSPHGFLPFPQLTHHCPSTLPARWSFPLLMAATQSEVENAYFDWCQQYGKSVEGHRMQIFAENFRQNEEYRRLRGTALKLDEFADQTPQERERMKNGQRKSRGKPVSDNPNKSLFGPTNNVNIGGMDDTQRFGRNSNTGAPQGRPEWERGPDPTWRGSPAPQRNDRNFMPGGIDQPGQRNEPFQTFNSAAARAYSPGQNGPNSPSSPTGNSMFNSMDQAQNGMKKNFQQFGQQNNNPGMGPGPGTAGRPGPNALYNQGPVQWSGPNGSTGNQRSNEAAINLRDSSSSSLFETMVPPPAQFRNPESFRNDLDWNGDMNSGGPFQQQQRTPQNESPGIPNGQRSGFDSSMNPPGEGRMPDSFQDRNWRFESNRMNNSPLPPGSWPNGDSPNQRNRIPGPMDEERGPLFDSMNRPPPNARRMESFNDRMNQQLPQGRFDAMPPPAQESWNSGGLPTAQRNPGQPAQEQEKSLFESMNPTPPTVRSPESFGGPPRTGRFDEMGPPSGPMERNPNFGRPFSPSRSTEPGTSFDSPLMSNRGPPLSDMGPSDCAYMYSRDMGASRFREDQKTRFARRREETNHLGPNNFPKGGGPSMAPLAPSGDAQAAYLDWCMGFQRTPTERGFANFIKNKQDVDEYNQRTGSRMQLNAYSDLSPEEFQRMKQDVMGSLGPNRNNNVNNFNNYNANNFMY